MNMRYAWQRIVRKVNFFYEEVLVFPRKLILFHSKKNQKYNFKKLQKQFFLKYNKLKTSENNDFITPHWEFFNKKITKALLPAPSFNFLQNQHIRQTMVVRGKNWYKKELAFLEKGIAGKELKQLLVEEYAGKPELISNKYLTSENTIHHLYHLIKYKNTANVNFSNFQTVIEWGGGYGNLAKLYLKLVDSNVTYIIIDTSLFSVLQWLYLATVFGQDRVHLIDQAEEKISPGRINIIPVSFIKKFTLEADLFISTWALSESSKAAQDYVANKNWFEAKHLLIAYQKSSASLPDAENISQLIPNNAKIEEISFIPGSYYVFK
ncbi:MAG: hypothetical protein ABIG60_02625 [Patescibacteria group bacterium]